MLHHDDAVEGIFVDPLHCYHCDRHFRYSVLSTEGARGYLTFLARSPFPRSLESPPNQWTAFECCHSSKGRWHSIGLEVVVNLVDVAGLVVLPRLHVTTTSTTLGRDNSQKVEATTDKCKTGCFYQAKHKTHT